MEKNLQKLLLSAVLVLLAVFSFLFLADRASAPDTHAATVAVIDEKTEDVLKLTASASLASFGVSAIPGDTATPIAGKLADFSEYFLLILCVLYSEKYLLSIIGAGVFKVLIPCACVLGIVSLWRHPALFRRLALKLTAVGVALYLLIPLSFKVSDLVYGAYRASIDGTIQAAETLTDETAPLADAAEDKGTVQAIIDRLADRQGRGRRQPLCRNARRDDRDLLRDPPAGAAVFPLGHPAAHGDRSLRFSSPAARRASAGRAAEAERANRELSALPQTAKKDADHAVCIFSLFFSLCSKASGRSPAHSRQTGQSGRSARAWSAFSLPRRQCPE